MFGECPLPKFAHTRGTLMRTSEADTRTSRRQEPQVRFPRGPAVYASVMRALVFAASAAMLTASAASSQAIDPATGLPVVRTTAPAPTARDSLWQKRWWI